jgi:hypothetical protein
MKRTCEAFFMIEMVMYVLLTTAMFLMSFEWLHTYCVQHTQQTQRQAYILHAYHVVHTILQDLSQACHSPHGWFTMHHEHTYVWKVGHEDHGIRLQGHRLMRLQGVYDYSVGQWRELNSTLMIDKVHACSLSISDTAQDMVTLIMSIEGSTGPYKFSESVYMRNGQRVA